MLGEMGSNIGRNALFAGVCLADDLNKLFCRRGLEQITAGAGREGALDFHVAFEGGKHYNASIRIIIPDGNQRINSADIRKSHVHQSYIWFMLTKLLNRFMSGG